MEHRSEVRGIIDTEYNEAEVMEGFRNEGREEGLAEGLTQGETTKLIKQVYSKLRKNKTTEQIAEELEESDNISFISEIVGLIREMSPDLDQDEGAVAQAVFEKLSYIS